MMDNDSSMQGSKNKNTSSDDKLESKKNVSYTIFSQSQYSSSFYGQTSQTQTTSNMGGFLLFSEEVDPSIGIVN